MNEPACGLDAATAAYAARYRNSEGAVERILYGLLFPKTIEMALVSNLDPLEAALHVYRELPCSTLLLRYHVALERRNRTIIEQHRLRLVEERAGRQGGERPALGTRSTRSHRKRKSGQR